MEQADLPELMQCLVTGLNGLQNEYERLFEQYRGLDSSLTAARDQYNELAKLLDKSNSDTPPLSHASGTPSRPKHSEQPLSALEILELRNETNLAQTLRTAIEAASRFRDLRSQSPGVKIWSGPSADQSTMTSKLPSITESPMEQDFTIVGTPSRLGCPFAGMAGKKLSTHAASVVSRYNGSHSARDSPKDTGSAVGSSASRVHGRESNHRSSSRRRSSMLDPIKAEICGLDSHDPNKQPPKEEYVDVEEVDGAKEGEPGVCPIRFLNQHSPEELAQYFEKHKHELPRSHEVCVRRYQSNEEQVRELDAKYGDVAQMIRGLGEKHQDYLPKDLEDKDAAADEPQTAPDVVGDGRVEKWASNVSPSIQADAEDVDEDARLPHFSRPLRDVRLGESPSRPWGIQVPAQYLEKARSDASSAPVQIESSGAMPAGHPGVSQAKLSTGAKCPFASAAKADDFQETAKVKQRDARAEPDLVEEVPAKALRDALPKDTKQSVVFNGPVIIGYSPDDAARFLQSLAQAQH